MSLLCTCPAVTLTILDARVATDLILTRARALESYVYDKNPPPEGTNAYRQKMRSLFLNLKAANNPSLREDVVSGEITVSRLANMTPAVSRAAMQHIST